MTVKISLLVSAVWVCAHTDTPLSMYICIHTCVLAVYLKHVLSTLEKPFSCEILYTNLFCRAWDLSQYRGRLPCHSESICSLLELSLTEAMRTFLFMLGDCLLAEAKIIQQAQNYSIVLYRSSHAAVLYLDFFFFKVIHMIISLYSWLANSLTLTFCVHGVFICQESWTASSPEIGSPRWLKVSRIVHFHYK